MNEKLCFDSEALSAPRSQPVGKVLPAVDAKLPSIWDEVYPVLIKGVSHWLENFSVGQGYVAFGRYHLPVGPEGE